MVSPRKSRSKSLCYSSNVTGTRCRANRSASIIPPGPPPTTQQLVWRVSRMASVEIKSGAFFGMTDILGNATKAKISGEYSQPEKMSQDSFHFLGCLISDSQSPIVRCARRNRVLSSTGFLDFLSSPAR
jgi:hypothetical protein